MHKPLMSVGRFCDGGNKVLFDSKRGCMQFSLNGKENNLQESEQRVQAESAAE